jgi:hypothetical protein
MTTKKELVGAWISARRDELRIPVRRLAELIDVSEQTVLNTQEGRSELKHGRTALEDVLDWERGSIARAYKSGEPPRPRVEPTPPADLTAAEILATATKREQTVLVAALLAIREQYGQSGMERRAAV